MIKIRFWAPWFLALGLALPLAAADFEIGPRDNASADSAPDAGDDAAPVRHRHPAEGAMASDYPVRLDAGDVPTAYGLRKYDLRADLRFYDGGGILTKAYLGLFPRFFIGGAADVRNVIGSGPLSMTRDDAQLLARLNVLVEDEDVPAVAVGYDGPAYEHGAARGLYLAVSKELPTSLAFIQVHGGLNSGRVDTFNADHDLRASAALTTAVQNLGLFTEVDEVLDPLGPRWNAGLEGYFHPLILALEFRDLASPRPGVGVSRLLRLSYIGRF